MYGHFVTSIGRDLSRQVVARERIDSERRARRAARRGLRMPLRPARAA